ncbi:hypothetical protein ACTGZQ_08930 [Streptococcus suis]
MSKKEKNSETFMRNFRKSDKFMQKNNNKLTIIFEILPIRAIAGATDFSI